jgi:hypothetical protein
MLSYTEEHYGQEFGKTTKIVVETKYQIGRAKFVQSTA